MLLAALALHAALSAAAVYPPDTCHLATVLCAQDGRFSVTVDFQGTPLGPSLPAHAVPVTADSGYFWFFTPQNVEVVVKVLDGRPVNGAYWVFFGALSNVAYRVTVRDTATSAVWTHENRWGEMASVADTNAFPARAEPRSVSRQSAVETIWTSIGPGDLYEHPVFSISPDPQAPQVIYVAHGDSTQPDLWGAVSRSLDAGATWTTLLRSRDGGPVVMDPADSSHVFYGANGVWRTLDGGSTWSGPSGPETYALAVNGSTVYAGTWQVVSISRDFGDSWTDALLPDSDDDNPTVTALAIDPERPERIFAGTSGGYLWRSSDNGASWDLVWSRHYDGITSIVLDAFDQRLVHVGTTHTGPSPMHFAIPSPHLRSADGGTNWTESFLPAELGAGGFDALVLDPSHPGVLYAGSDGGVYRSVDHGETWRSIGDIGRVTSLAGSGSALYAGTFGGAFAADISGLPAACSGDPFTLCLNSGRFQVRASWQGSPDGPTVEATPVPLTADTGAFWFFTPSNVELVVKVLDGRPVNRHFWVFVGGLSSVQYSIEVTDTETGEVWTHDHASGELESFADTAAF